MGTPEAAVGDAAARRVVILGSGPAAPEMAALVDPDAVVVVVNNAWRATPRFDFFVHPPDFPPERHPDLTDAPGKRIDRRAYMPGFDAFGGIIFGGATMAFAAGYWVLATFPRAQVTICASDMVYDQAAGGTHFYGQGTADPLRRNITLQSLEALSCRLFHKGISRGSLLLNGTHEARTRLVLPVVPLRDLGRRALLAPALDLYERQHAAEAAAIAADAERMEAAAPFDARTPRYGIYRQDRAAWAYVAEVNQAWLRLRPVIAAFEAGLRGLAERG